ncbi:hypothetical protein DLE01_42745 [Streptomyces sp. FT05W]|nr:hypothetical protein DLE01_42745 [Streptomyces sp. FT05W]
MASDVASAGAEYQSSALAWHSVTTGRAIERSTELPRRSGLPDAERLLDQPEWVEWRGGRAHTYAAA